MYKLTAISMDGQHNNGPVKADLTSWTIHLCGSIGDIVSRNQATLKYIDMKDCTLDHMTVPDSLAGVKHLGLRQAKNIPPELISRALRDGIYIRH